MTLIEGTNTDGEGGVGGDALCEVWLPSDPQALVAWGREIMDRLGGADLAVVDEEWFGTFAESVSGLGSQVLAAEVAVAAECERRRHFRRHGLGSTKAWVKHRTKTSGPVAAARVQVMRLFELSQSWAHAARAGEVGQAQVVLMARVAANPRVQAAFAEVDEMLLTDAVVLPYDRFEERLRNWERLADPDGAAAVAERNHQGRDVRLRQRADGGWDLSGRFGSLQGAEMNDVLARFFQAEWDTDWADARRRAGVDADHDGSISVADLARNDGQRRADALTKALLTAAGSRGRRAGLTVNVLIDERSLECSLTGVADDHRRYRSVECRTQSGHRLDIAEVTAAALWEHLRRVVHDGAGTVIDLGRRQRLFTGSSREAAMLLDVSCWLPGCDRPVTFCQADHAVEWQHQGATDSENGRPGCRTHNPLTYREGFRSYRDDLGEWHLLDRHGNEID